MPPITMLIKPASSLCNMKCRYCFYADVSDSRTVKSYGMMSLDTLKILVKKTFEYADGYAGFAFQGGEPTLAGLDFYRHLIEFVQEYNVKRIPVQYSVQTNGYHVTEDMARFFADKNFLIGLSMDGTKDIHDSLRLDGKGAGTYNTVAKTAALFDKHGVEYNILCVVNNFTARYPAKVYNGLKKYKYLQFIACIDDFDGAKEKYSLTNERYAEFLKVTFDEYYKDFISGNYVSVRNFDNYIKMLQGLVPENCAMSGFCTCYFVIEGDGSVFPCDFYVLDEWKLGNLHESNFEEMKSSAKAAEFVNISKNIHTKCKSCNWQSLCRGGCRRDREIFPDGSIGLNRFCESYRSFFEHSYPKMNEIVLRLRAK